MTINLKRIASLVFLAAATCLSTPAFAAGGVSLTVEGVKSGKGNIIAIVFDNAAAYKAFDLEKAVDLAEIPARKGHVQHHFKDLTKGQYAIFVFHDENGDEDLGMSWGQPVEGLGLSGDTGKNEDPSFKQAAVAPGPVSIKLHYPD